MCWHAWRSRIAHVNWRHFGEVCAGVPGGAEPHTALKLFWWGMCWHAWRSRIAHINWHHFGEVCAGVPGGAELHTSTGIILVRYVLARLEEQNCTRHWRYFGEVWADVNWGAVPHTSMTFFFFGEVCAGIPGGAVPHTSLTFVWWGMCWHAWRSSTAHITDIFLVRYVLACLEEQNRTSAGVMWRYCDSSNLISDQLMLITRDSFKQWHETVFGSVMELLRTNKEKLKSYCIALYQTGYAPPTIINIHVDGLCSWARESYFFLPSCHQYHFILEADQAASESSGIFLQHRNSWSNSTVV